MADSETTSNESQPAAPEAPPPSRRRGWRILARFGLFGGSFLLALVTSWICREQAREDEEPTEVQIEPPKTHAKQIDSAGSPVEMLARGDEALQRQSFTEALSYYEELLAGAAVAAPLVDYRFGLCHEALGQADRAMAAYRKAASAAAAPALAWASHLGMARALLQQNQPGQARRLLYPFLFDATRRRNVPAPFVADARYVIALAIARQTHRPPSPRLADDEPVSFVAVPLEVPCYFQELGFPGLANGKLVADAPAPPRVLVRKQTTPRAALILEADQASQPAWQALDAVVKEAGLRLEWSAEAKTILADRPLRLCLRNWPLIDLLEQAADHFDLACTVENDVAYVKARDEVDPARLAAADRTFAGRALRGAVQADDGHPWTAAAYLELGNWEAVDGKLAEAAAWFERLRREKPTSPYAAAATYNLAKLHVRQQDFTRARQAFFRVIDHSPGDELALRSELRIGQLYLEQDDVGHALVQLRRAQASVPRSPYQPLAALVLAAAYLQADQPDQCRAVLGKQRPVLQKDPYKPTAAFLDIYAQYRLAKATSAGRREASELLSSLWRDQDEDVLGPVGHCLRAEAYRDLGFQEQAERLLRQAEAHTKGPMALHLSFLLADTLLKLNRRDEASHLFEKLAATHSPFRGQAKWQLARLDLDDKHYQDCVHKCQELWTEQAISDSTALLQLWGAALEGVGDFAKAAQCFAGQAPE